MIKFFRKIRQELVNGNRLSKYLLYALGEIVLVVIGILIALQISNENEKRKVDKQFDTTIEELYSSIKFDVERLSNAIQYRDSQLKTLAYILNHKDSVPPEVLIRNIYDISAAARPFSSETEYFQNRLTPDPENVIHNDLVREINNYVNQLKKRNELLDTKVYQMLREKGIPFPLPGYNFEIGPDTRTEPGYYTEEDYQSISQLMESHLFISELKTLAVNVFYDKAEARVKYSNGTSLLNKIKEYYPDVKLLFKDVGIIGTAINGFDDVGARSTPMTNTDVANAVWEVELYLKPGAVKFRCRDSWSQNWGGSSFPAGVADYEGEDIRIPEAGNYRISLNLSRSRYQFTKL